MNFATLKESAIITMGSAPKGDTYNFDGNGHALIAGAGDFGIDNPNPKKWTTSPTKISEKGDLILCIRATIGDLNWADKEYCLGRGVAGIRAKGHTDLKYLSYAITAFKSNLMREATGSTFLQIKRSTIEDLKIPLPPLAEQMRIAAILDKADAIRRKQQKAIDLCDQFLKALFIDMFGDGFKERTFFKPISEETEFIDYRGTTPERVDSGVPLISAKCVRPGWFNASRLDYITEETYQTKMTRGFPKENEVLFTTEGATLGYVCRIPYGYNYFSVGQRLITVRCKGNLREEYLDFVLNDERIQNEVFKKATGSAAKGIRAKEFKKIEIPIAPLDLQNKFAEIVKKTEAKKAKLQKSLSRLNDSFNALSQKAFKGEL